MRNGSEEGGGEEEIENEVNEDTESGEEDEIEEIEDNEDEEEIENDVNEDTESGEEDEIEGSEDKGIRGSYAYFELEEEDAYFESEEEDANFESEEEDTGFETVERKSGDGKTIVKHTFNNQKFCSETEQLRILEDAILDALYPSRRKLGDINIHIIAIANSGDGDGADLGDLLGDGSSFSLNDLGDIGHISGDYSLNLDDLGNFDRGGGCIIDDDLFSYAEDAVLEAVKSY
ncbi:expressed unknown protein [Seminavis robusta]|uniref:Uncharacterized protein n=1 Tax=Seminavis robusta TaxID=568900 RepID=A0A9N8EWK8_9STRA|nr:expressed unknown protein [Seminavis robusta]|eukprot:Sro1915_g305140.1 n/a (232) ;mRNA; r:13970-14771